MDSTRWESSQPTLMGSTRNYKGVYKTTNQKPTSFAAETLMGSKRKYSMASEKPSLSVSPSAVKLKERYPISPELYNEAFQSGYSTPQNFKSTLLKYTMPVDEQVKFSLRKHAFGIDDYNPHMKTLPDKVLQVPDRRLKRETFVDTIPKQKKFIPGPKFKSHWDWRDTPSGKLTDKAPRSTWLDTIIAKTKIPEKSTPSPHQYSQFESWKHSDRSRKVVAVTKRNEQRTSFLDEQILLANEVPGPQQYPTTKVVSLNQLIVFFSMQDRVQRKEPASNRDQAINEPFAIRKRTRVAIALAIAIAVLARRSSRQGDPTQRLAAIHEK